MTEQEWLAGDTGVLYMLWHVTDTLRLKRSRAGRRKLRLFACGCCRLLWDRLDEPRRAVVTMIERVADDERNKAELEAARRRCLELFAETKRGTADELRALSDNLLSAVACDKAYPAAFSMTTLALWKFGEAAGGVKGADIARYLLREVFGNPFHPVAVARHWLTWNDGIVKKVAQGIYDDHAFERLPILADALEEAGCADGDILGHLRGPGPHVRGCWAVDLILGKQ